MKGSLQIDNITIPVVQNVSKPKCVIRLTCYLSHSISVGVPLCAFQCYYERLWTPCVRGWQVSALSTQFCTVDPQVFNASMKWGQSAPFRKTDRFLGPSNTKDGISPHRLKRSRHNCINLKTTPARLQIERDSIRLVIVNNEKFQPIHPPTKSTH